ncbi:MAG: tRNA (guanosine(46)-N7)-methyltransferase TrmB, partial [Gemmatimonadota bacterium]
MPHVVLQTSSPLYELVERVQPFVAQEGETVWRLRDVFLNRDDSHALAECLVVVRGRLTRFFVHLAQRESDASVVVRPYAIPRIESRPSIKRMVALVAEAVRAAHPDVEISRGTIGDYLSDRYVYAPDPEPSGFDPLLPAAALPAPVDWSAIFGNDGPVEIEIGSGKGTFLVDAAERRPDTNFLALEYAADYAEHLRDRVRRRRLENVRVARAEAVRFFEDHVAEGSVRAIHVYFPDPWPKKRHHKRRLLSPAFAALAARALEPGGEIRLVTDHAEYFEEAAAALAAAPGLEAAPVDEAAMSDTNYERKYRAEGRPIHRAVFRRVGEGLS